jgi:hypothetical protein
MIVLSFVLACENKSKPAQTTIEEHNIDTTISFEIGKYWATPNKAFEFNTLIGCAGDTLSLVSCSDFVFYPFGEVKSKKDIENGLLKSFSVSDKIDTMENGIYEFQILKHGKSRLILFLDDDEEATRHSYIFKGDIYESDINFKDSIKIGMSKRQFINTFFDYFPEELLDKYKFIVFESCVEDIRHTYTFNENELQSVNFKTISYWKVDY